MLSIMAVNTRSKTRLSSSAPRGPSEANSSAMRVKPDISLNSVAAASQRGSPGINCSPWFNR